MDIKNKKVLVLGLGKSGIAAGRLLLSRGAEVWVTEKENNIELRHIADELSKTGAVVELGGHSKSFLSGAEFIITCPGVSRKCAVFNWAGELGIPVISEIEFASRFISCPIIAVTGTNGKSTVTSLIDHIFKSSGKNTVACGNIGLPLCDVVLKKDKLDAVVVEVSSFQLEYIDKFKPRTAVWLNISCDHMDEHLSMENYINSKLNIFRNQTEDDWAVVSSKETNRIKDIVKSKVAVFKKDTGGYSCPGVFGENISAAVRVVNIFSVNHDDIKSALQTFKPLAHRLESITTIGGVEFVNDSKATNVASMLAALETIKKPIILILGGRDKGDDFSKLKDLLKDKINAVIVMGEDRLKISKQLGNIVPLIQVEKISDAVRYGFENASFGTSILLSPGCTSFDMFKDYKERGDEFRRCVLNLSDKFQVSNNGLKSEKEISIVG